MNNLVTIKLTHTNYPTRGSISSNTIIQSNIVVDWALWELYEEKYKHIDSLVFADMINKMARPLVDKADTLYTTNPNFRKGITNTERGRDTLAMWFKHWGEKLINDKLNKK